MYWYVVFRVWKRDSGCYIVVVILIKYYCYYSMKCEDNHIRSTWLQVYGISWLVIMAILLVMKVKEQFFVSQIAVKQTIGARISCRIP